MPQQLTTDSQLRNAVSRISTSRRCAHRAVRRCWRVGAACALVLALAQVLRAQDLVAPGAAPAVGADWGAPVIEQGGGNFFSQDLGTMLRIRYNTESYGQNHSGNLDLGTMQVVTFDESAAFFDGQVTLNDEQGVGFNVGVGFRWLNYPVWSAGTGRMDGISLWVDGTHTEAGNFFPQIGLSYESLGELWDFRANGYTPVGDDEQIGNFVGTGELGFQGNTISELTQAVVDRSFYAAELEAARRLGPDRDAWAFAGPYFLANDHDDAVGYRAGLRGYAYPDLLLQIAVSNDDIFDTYATFQIVWFVGRTRTDFQPACDVRDRFREPVMRNDYVVLAQDTVTGGNALTNADGSALRIVHVDSTAAPGGDGTFENPYDMLTDANGAGSMEGDIILAHAGSVFNGQSIVLQDNQRLLGEGNGVEHEIVTAEEGIFVLPETAPGALNGARPMIVAALGDAITLADSNEVSNFDIDGNGTTARAIVSPAAGSGNPLLNNLAISDTTGHGIALTPLELLDSEDVDGDGNTTETIVRGNVSISDVAFNNVGGDDINIDAATTANVNAANVQLQEVISITDVTSDDPNGRGIVIANTHSGTGRTATVNNYTYDGGTTGLGGIVLQNFDSTFTASNSSLTGGAAGGVGFQVLGDSDGSITVQDSVELAGITGTAVDINGDDAGTDELEGTIVVNSDITNSAGRSVSVQNIAGGSVTLNGDITDTGEGILVNSNSGGLVLFAGDLDMDTTTNDAITVTDNTDTDVDFTGELDIDTTSGDGFVATGGGNLTIAGTTNSIDTETGQAVNIQGMAIDSTVGANFERVNRSTGAATSAIEIRNNTGGPIVLGDPIDDTPGDSGTLQGGDADTVVISNSANTAISGFVINNAANRRGVSITKSNNNEMVVDLNTLRVNDGEIGINVEGNGTTGDLTMTVNDTEILGSTDAGLNIDDVDDGTIAVNNATIDGNNASAAADGVRITNSDAAITFDGDTTIQEFGGTDFEVSGGAGTISYAGDIVNASATNASDTTGRSVDIRARTGGNVTFTGASTITDDNEGIYVQNNTGGTVNIQGDNDLDTGAADALTVTGNTGGNYNFANFDITTTSGTGVTISGNGAGATIDVNGVDIAVTGSGDGFVATGPGTLSVRGANNTIETDTGVGLDVTNMTISNNGVSFQSVNVDGAANGIVLDNLTGGTVIIGSPVGAQNSGGTLTTTGNSIIVRNVESADINNVRIANSGSDALLIEHTGAATTAMDVTIDGLNLDAATGNGVVVNSQSNNDPFVLRFEGGDLEENVVANSTGSALFQMRVEDTTIDVANGTDAFATTFSGSSTNADLILRDVDFSAGDASAASIVATGGTAKTVDLLVEDSVFNNNSGTSSTVDILSTGSSTIMATIQGNTFDNANAAGSDFDMTSDGAAARVRLNLGGDVAADFNMAAGAGEFNLHELNGSDFDVFEKDDTFGGFRNNGTVVPDPNAAAFDDLPVAPTPPVIP